MDIQNFKSFKSLEIIITAMYIWTSVNVIFLWNVVVHVDSKKYVYTSSFSFKCIFHFCLRLISARKTYI